MTVGSLYVDTNMSVCLCIEMKITEAPVHNRRDLALLSVIPQALLLIPKSFQETVGGQSY